MNKEQLLQNIKKKSSFLCVGLDTDIKRIPPHLLKERDPVFEFNRQIIEATADWCVAYKPNLAFYESLGPAGWESLEKTLDIIPEEIFTIADAKRGDIGNTSALYARAFFDNLKCDAVTINPYIGEDSVSPFLEYEGKWAILLALTSNDGSDIFQQQLLKNGSKVYEHIILESQKWGNDHNMMYVVGATQASKLHEIRKLVPDHFLLVPGVGAQGGSLADVAKNGMNKDCGLLVNASRSIIYSDSGKNFAMKASESARKLAEEMGSYLNSFM